MIFQDDLAGGVTLIRPALQSPNYVTGVSGWSIKVDGSAEFNNIVIRGSTTSGGQAFYYDGPPALGNLILSISGAAGNDSFGNAYVKGLGAYGAAGQIIAKDAAGDTATLAGNIGGGGVLAAMPGLAMQPVFNVAGDPATIGALDPGDHATFSLLLTSPSDVVGGLPGTNYSQINMLGQHVGPTNITLDAANITFNSAANIDVNGRLDTYGGNTFTFYVPTVTGGGAVTWTTQTGLWERVGKMIFVNILLVVNAAGTGAAAVSVTAPTNIARSQRQVLNAHGGGLGGPGAGEYTALSFTGGGPSAVIDRITRNGVDLVGANLTAGATIAIEGWYREA